MSKGSARLTVALLGVLGILLALGIIPRLARRRDLLAEIAISADSAPRVIVTTARFGPGAAAMSLPGSIDGVRDASLYARSNGYVKRWLVDMGAPVDAGQLLAEIEIPELDQELDQARANLAQVQAALELTRATLQRWQQLSKDGAVTQQELDEKQAAFNSALANQHAAQANVDRMTALQRFSRVVAPFAGVVTARNVEVGTLVSATPAAGAKPLFMLAEVDTVRIMVNVPQSFVPNVHVGETAGVTIQEMPGVKFVGRITRTAQSLDPGTRTLLTEVRLLNTGLRLLPGTYAQVQLEAPNARPVLLIPSNTLMILPSGTHVATVKDGRIRLALVELGRDFGAQLEVRTGLSEGDVLVVNPGDDVKEGAPVRIAPSAPGASRSP